jgi:hypothetical protein
LRKKRRGRMHARSLVVKKVAGARASLGASFDSLLLTASGKASCRYCTRFHPAKPQFTRYCSPSTSRFPSSSYLPIGLRCIQPSIAYQVDHIHNIPYSAAPACHIFLHLAVAYLRITSTTLFRPCPACLASLLFHPKLPLVPQSLPS